MRPRLFFIGQANIGRNRGCVGSGTITLVDALAGTFELKCCPAAPKAIAAGLGPLLQHQFPDNRVGIVDRGAP